MTTKFWYDDISILYDKNYFLEFIPYRDFDFNRKLNSIVRLSIYYSIIVYILTSSKNVFCVPFIVIIITVFLYKNYKNNRRNRLTSLLRNNTSENTTNTTNTKKAVNNLIKNDSLLNNSINNSVNNSINSNYANPIINNRVNHKEEENRLNQIDNIIKDINDSCNLPTNDNPFMNLNTYDLSNGEKSAACKSYNNRGIKNIVENKFNNDLYLDSNDLFNRRNSQRQFYTMPNTSIPNRQDDFKNFLYGDMHNKTCKEGNCTTTSGGWTASPAPNS
tara:strand:- start:4888 stop:5712 length:825 start_codon:yes stop_codon:yes gene_type:complete